MNIRMFYILALVSLMIITQAIVAEVSNRVTDSDFLKNDTSIENTKISVEGDDSGNYRIPEADSTLTKITKPFKSKLGIEFVPIPAGEFMMGCSIGDNDCEDSEKPVHKVKITKGFYMGKYEVTQAQWKAVMGANPSNFNSCGEDCPVEQVSWDDVQHFLRNLNIKEGRTGERKIRLPTEAEWEYAVRAGSRSKTYTTDLGSIAWYKKNSDNKTHPVGKKKPNSFGLYDMIGNVWEWVEDWYDDQYYATSTSDDPKGSAKETIRVLRGGSWNHNAEWNRASFRDFHVPTFRSDLGFRLVAPQN